MRVLTIQVWGYTLATSNSRDGGESTLTRGA